MRTDDAAVWQLISNATLNGCVWLNTQTSTNKSQKQTWTQAPNVKSFINQTVFIHEKHQIEVLYQGFRKCYILNNFLILILWSNWNAIFLILQFLELSLPQKIECITPGTCTIV